MSTVRTFHSYVEKERTFHDHLGLGRGTSERVEPWVYSRVEKDLGNGIRVCTAETPFFSSEEFRENHPDARVSWLSSTSAEVASGGAPASAVHVKIADLPGYLEGETSIDRLVEMRKQDTRVTAQPFYADRIGELLEDLIDARVEEAEDVADEDMVEVEAEVDEAEVE